MIKTDFSGMLLWQEETPKGTFGPGLSRPREGERTKPYTLQVVQGNGRPMRVTLQAPNKRTALRYGRNRWPDARVEAA